MIMSSLLRVAQQIDGKLQNSSFENYEFSKFNFWRFVFCRLVHARVRAVGPRSVQVGYRRALGIRVCFVRASRTYTLSGALNIIQTLISFLFHDFNVS